MGITIYEPEVEKFSVTVSVPMHVPVHLSLSNNIERCEESFIKMRDNWAKTDVERRDYDRCRATLKWAACCSASLERVAPCKYKDRNSIKFTFAFGSMDAVNQFYEGLREKVRSAVE